MSVTYHFGVFCSGDFDFSLVVSFVGKFGVVEKYWMDESDDEKVFRFDMTLGNFKYTQVMIEIEDEFEEFECHMVLY